MASPESCLDNPIWHALTARHNDLSLGGDLARRYLPDIGPLSGLREETHEAYQRLAPMATKGNPAVLFLRTAPDPPAGWNVLLHASLVQMICRDEPKYPEGWSEKSHPIIRLQEEDVPEMLALTALTEPGPFRKRTWELGGFVGIRVNGVLAAMGGKRLAPTGFTEISAVCTHPDFRGNGFAQALVAAVAAGVRVRGETPFLTVLASNVNAIRVYEKAGLVQRRTLHLGVVEHVE